MNRFPLIGWIAFTVSTIASYSIINADDRRKTGNPFVLKATGIVAAEVTLVVWLARFA